jgi:precorrin-6Y C5,15-methyltransferase (decarboxylating)
LVLENLSTAVNALKARGFIPDITLVNVARSQEIASLTRLEALNPVFVIAASKKEASVPYE